MAASWLRYLVVALLSQYCSTSDVFDRVLDDVKACKDECDKTYTQQTISNEKHSSCCKRGCRFFSIVEFINDHQNMNATKDACMASCMEAYSQTGDRYACNIGCANQMPFSLEKQKQVKDDPPTMHLLTPFMMVHNIYNNMVNHMSRIMSVSWSFYFQQDNGKMVVIQSEPEVITEYLDMDEIDYEKNQEESNDSVDDSTRDQPDEQRLQVQKSFPDLSLRLVPDGYLGSRMDEVSSRGVLMSENEDINSGMDWLGCVARKSGLPRWLIGFTILSSALAMVWLCFTTTATAPEHHIRPQKIKLYGDVEYLNKMETQEKVRIQPESEYQAPPLPLKINMSVTS